MLFSLLDVHFIDKKIGGWDWGLGIGEVWEYFRSHYISLPVSLSPTANSLLLSN